MATIEPIAQGIAVGNAVTNPDWTSITPFPIAHYDNTATTYASATITREAYGENIKSALEKYLFQPMTPTTLHDINQTLGAITYTTTDFDSTTNTVHHRWYEGNGTDTTMYGLGYRMPEYTFGSTENTCYCQREMSKEEKLKEKVRSNLLIKVKSRASLLHDVTPAEAVAMETLREELSESEFRKYIKYGFILIKAASGKTYQVFRNQTHTKVWLGGKLIEEVCIKIQDSQVPRTDNVIAFKTMIEADEEEFLKLGNRYKNLNTAAA